MKINSDDLRNDLRKFQGEVKEVEVFRNMFGQYCVRLKYEGKEINLYSETKIEANFSEVKYVPK